MEESARLFVGLGAVFLIGLAAETIGRRTRLPRVTLLLVIGFFAGPACLGLLPESQESTFRLAANVALTMVGFLLGEHLGHATKKGPERREMLWVSIAVVLATAAMVFGGLMLAGVSAVTALLLAGVATATDPAATMDVVRETGTKSVFSRILLAVVAVDDAWGLIVFSLMLAGAEALAGNGDGAVGSLLHAGYELGGAIALGGALGVAMAFLTGRIADGQPTVLEAIGFVFLCCGLALTLEVSFILTAMTMGTVLSRLAKHHERPFHVIENIELPFMIVFFVLAGAALDLGSLGVIGWLGAGYIGFRILGRLAGGWLGARVTGARARSRRWIGAALMPQAGVALGMALLASQRLPGEGEAVLQVAIAATVFFEIFGPILTRLAILRTE